LRHVVRVKAHSAFGVALSRGKKKYRFQLPFSVQGVKGTSRPFRFYCHLLSLVDVVKEAASLIVITLLNIEPIPRPGWSGKKG
jgi:hypothetical protein